MVDAQRITVIVCLGRHVDKPGYTQAFANRNLSREARDTTGQAGQQQDMYFSHGMYRSLSICGIGPLVNTTLSFLSATRLSHRHQIRSQN